MDLNKHIKLRFKKKINQILKKKNYPFYVKYAMNFSRRDFSKGVIEKTLSKALQVQKLQKLILHIGASWLEKCNFRIKDWSSRTKVIAGNPLCLQMDANIKCHPSLLSGQRREGVCCSIHRLNQNFVQINFQSMVNYLCLFVVVFLFILYLHGIM